MVGIANASTIRKRPYRRHKWTIRSYEHSIENIDMPFCQYLSMFGRLIPEVKVMANKEQIVASHICYDTLYKVAEIKIEWVNSLSLHLEFDTVRKTLKVFKFPSFCRLMYHERTVISK